MPAMPDTSFIKSVMPQRLLVAAAYGTVMYILAEIFANPVLQTHAIRMAMPK